MEHRNQATIGSCITAMVLLTATAGGGCSTTPQPLHAPGAGHEHIARWHSCCWSCCGWQYACRATVLHCAAAWPAGLISAANSRQFTAPCALGGAKAGWGQCCLLGSYMWAQVHAAAGRHAPAAAATAVSARPAATCVADAAAVVAAAAAGAVDAATAADCCSRCRTLRECMRSTLSRCSCSEQQV
jgi:hypothetical protein